jgi:hypothetical protein
MMIIRGKKKLGETPAQVTLHPLRLSFEVTLVSGLRDEETAYSRLNSVQANIGIF